MPETTNKEGNYQSISFDAIRIGLASPRKDPGMVPRRGKETGDD